MWLSSSSVFGEGKGAPSMKALVASEYSGCSSSGWFQTPVLGSGVGSISGIIVGGSSDIARCRRR